jgi:hypothetical protein
MTLFGKKYFDYFILLGVFCLNLGLWFYSSPKLPQWANVPPAPSTVSATVAFLGDKEMAYRSVAIILQSFGNNTGQVQALKDYNYPNLGTWFDLADNLNKRSNYVPFLAAYYFGGSQDPSELMPVINYLRRVGAYPYEDKWRYLGQAVFLAKHKMKDTQIALELADELAKTYKPGMPAWPLQMKAIIASEMGEKEMAYNLMVDAITNQKEGMDPIEINYMIDQVCNHILTPIERSKNPLCENIKP